MEPKRKVILARLKTLLEGIENPDSTREHFFRKVERMCYRPWDLSPMPAASIWPKEEDPAKAPDNMVRFDLEVQLHLVVTGNEEQVADDLETADALVKKLIEENMTIAGVWKRCEINHIGILGVSGKKDVALENVILGIQYDREKGNPYS